MLGAEYDFDLEPTANKGCWWNCFIFPVFLLSLVWILDHIFGGNNFCFLQEKIFTIQQVHLFMSDELENN